MIENFLKHLRQARVLGEKTKESSVIFRKRKTNNNHKMFASSYTYYVIRVTEQLRSNDQHFIRTEVCVNAHTTHYTDFERFSASCSRILYLPKNLHNK